MPDRLITIDAPGFDSSKDELVVTLLTGHEGLSRLFNFQVGLVSKNLDIRPESFIGKRVNLKILRDSGSPRHINGFISRFSAGGTVPGNGGAMFRVYNAEIVPWLWFLTQTTDCRVFNNPPEGKLKVISIIEEVLRECEHQDFSLKSMGSGKDYETEYCVQYRETDFNFISRLMEKHGIYYYFQHQEGSHKLILSDSLAGYTTAEEATVSQPGSFGAHATDHITFWEHDYEFVPGRAAHTDYDFKKPSTDLRANSGESTAKLIGHKEFQIFDYPGGYESLPDGRTIIDSNIHAEEVSHNSVRGGGKCKTFSAGHTFTLEHAGTESGTYLLTSVQHVARQPGPNPGSATSIQYSNSFSCIPNSVLYQPPRSTPKPIVSGIQTALVVGPPGQEIECDKFGRVRVRFHWERDGVGKSRHENNSPKTPNEKCTCWIRVAHQVAGNKWGFVAIPRIGQEAVVDFLEGDPDRPLIVGSVYNAEQMPHYDLPANNAKSYIKTNSTQGGDGYNELMFDDAAGSERVFIHAQHDRDEHVLHDYREQIHNDKHRTIGTDKVDGKLVEKIYGDKHVTVKKSQQELIEGSYALKVGGGIENPGNLDIVVQNQQNCKIGPGGKHLVVDGDHAEKIGGKHSLQVTGDRHEACGGNYAVECSSGNVHIKAGMNVVIEAGLQLSFKVGGNFVSITPMGVDINGTLVNINSGGSAGSATSPSPDAPTDATDAAPEEPKIPWNSKTGLKSAKS